MDKDLLGFYIKEVELQEEIKNNPIKGCLYCSNWQYGGDMSYELYHCKQCGNRRAKSGTSKVISLMSSGMGISWDSAWDIANTFHHMKVCQYSSKNKIYFDEDCFTEDLTQFYLAIKPHLLPSVIPQFHVDNGKYIMGVDIGSGQDYSAVCEVIIGDKGTTILSYAKKSRIIPTVPKEDREGGTISLYDKENYYWITFLIIVLIFGVIIYIWG